jgi:hypothetical protein
MRMKDRLTVTIDSELAGQAKRLAHTRNTSVSGVVEESLRNTLRAPSRPVRTFVERWAGRLTVIPDDPQDQRLTALKAKYHLS